MAVAVKNTPEVEPSGTPVRMQVLSLVGVLFLVISIAMIFQVVPYLWQIIAGSLGLAADSFASATLLGLFMLVAGSGLVFVGLQLLASQPVSGLRAGIFVGFALLLLVLFLARWISMWIEYLAYTSRWFGPEVGAVLTAVLAAVLLAAAIRWFMNPAREKMLIDFENQGWFTTESYKKQQGLKVRRGTILALLVLVGAGVWTLVSHRTLARGAQNWELYIPFTGVATIHPEYAGDAEPLLFKDYPQFKEKVTDWVKTADEAARNRKPIPPSPGLQLSMFRLRDINDGFDPENMVKIVDDVPPFTMPGKNEPVQLSFGQIISRADYEAYERKVRQDNGYPETDRRKAINAIRPLPAWGEWSYSSLVLLPQVQYTVPLLLVVGALWLSWRIVNFPIFADFLIATEAEMNKVSWSTRKKLFQDTIVVLATMLLMAFYLFGVDQVWSHILSWKYVGVIQMPEDLTAGQKTVNKKPW